MSSEEVDARYQEIMAMIEAKRLHEMKGDHQLAQALKELEGEKVFDLKNHELAKRVFQKVMGDRGLAVSYEDATDWNTESYGGELDLSIFQWSVTRGVQNDIPKASQDNRVHLFSVASQYNGAEAPSVFTPPVGEAMIKSQGDYTQGPLAQRTNPPVFELVSAFLTHLGFNMMEEVLLSAGKTYIGGSPIEHGYLRPNNGNLEQLQEEMERNYTKINIPCYESRPTDQGGAVYLMLGSAPAIGYSHGLNNDNTKALQYVAYKAVFIPLFKKAAKLLRDQLDKEVVLHMTGIGLGVFACGLETYSAAFKEVALQFQSGLSEEERKRIHVQFESYQGNDQIKDVASRLGLGEAKPRVEYS